MLGEKQEREDIFAFTWWGERHVVDSGTEMLLKLCRELQAQHPDRFETLPDQFRAPRRTWFARNKHGLTRGHLIKHSHVWIETNCRLSAKKRLPTRSSASSATVTSRCG